MAEKLGLGPEVRELKIGSSFLSSRTAFHTLRYDFKPASVVTASKHASVEIGPNQEVTVTHLETAGAAQTVFKGSQRPYHKECVLIIDRTTGEITLEKLTTNIQLKKTRSTMFSGIYPSSPSHPYQDLPVHGGLSHGLPSLDNPSALGMPSPFSPAVLRQEMPKMSMNSTGRPPTPVEKKPSPPQGRTKSRGAGHSARVSPLHSSPSHPHRSPHMIHKSPPPVSSLSLSPSPSAGSLPMIGLDDANDNSTNSFDIANSLPELKSSPDFSGINFNEDDNALPGEVGILTDSSSDSSSDSNSSDSESDSGNVPHPPPPHKTMNGHVNGKSSPALSSMPEHLLNEDLQLSESGSDSD